MFKPSGLAGKGGVALLQRVAPVVIHIHALQACSCHSKIRKVGTRHGVSVLGRQGQYPQCNWGLNNAPPLSSPERAEQKLTSSNCRIVESVDRRIIPSPNQIILYLSAKIFKL